MYIYLILIVCYSITLQVAGFFKHFKPLSMGLSVTSLFLLHFCCGSVDQTTDSQFVRSPVRISWQRQQCHWAGHFINIS